MLAAVSPKCHHEHERIHASTVYPQKGCNRDVCRGQTQAIGMFGGGQSVLPEVASTDEMSALLPLQGWYPLLNNGMPHVHEPLTLGCEITLAASSH